MIVLIKSVTSSTIISENKLASSSFYVTTSTPNNYMKLPPEFNEITNKLYGVFLNLIPLRKKTYISDHLLSIYPLLSRDLFIYLSIPSLRFAKEIEIIENQ